MSSLTTDMFKVKLPDGWGEDSTILLATPLPGDLQLNVSIRLLKVADGTTAEALAKQQKDAFADSDAKVEILRCRAVSNRGKEGFELHSLWQNEKEEASYQRQMIFVEGESAFLLMASYPQDRPREIDAAVGRVFESFTPLVRSESTKSGGRLV